MTMPVPAETAHANNSATATTPLVCVLLATHNSAAWLAEQVDSITAQQGVRVRIVASDDASTDQTPALLALWQHSRGLHTLDALSAPLGRAHLNFLRLIRQAPVEDADYVALSDHDDIWLPSKLARAVDRLTATGAEAYSSNVIAFWADGRRRMIDKAQPQRRWDHLFSSPGPGCTFVFPRSAFLKLRDWVIDNHDELRRASVHDWLIYAYFRGLGRPWTIDAQAHMLYRQHAGNEIGANAGWQAAWRRLGRIRSGAYQHDIITVAELTGGEGRIVSALQRLSPCDRLWLIGQSRQCRRSWRESLALALLILLMPRQR